jgi:hypothetical protein
MPAATTTEFSIASFLRETISRAKSLAKAACEALLRERTERERGPLLVWNPWQRYWGEVYGLELKDWLLKPVFEELEKTGKAGDLIVDVGSGAQPVSRLFKARPGRRRICVDIAADNGGGGDEQRIRLDAEKVGEAGALSFRKAMARACKFLEIAPEGEGRLDRADLMVFSDLLNYVDFRKVLGRFAKYLKANGRIVIVNLPIRGNQALFSEKGLKDNHQLYEFLDESGFEIEHKAFPCRARGETEEAEELIVLVARKRGQPEGVLEFRFLNFD